MRSRALWMTMSIQLAYAASLCAQPWVPPKGEGSVSIVYQNYYVIGHFDAKGHENFNGATHAKAIVADVDVGLTDTLALTLSLPFIAAKYTGPSAYVVGGILTRPGPLDDRTYHGALQDLHAELRRECRVGPVAIAPLIGVTLPSHDYETHGEAVVGRHRRELQAGASAGTDLNRILPHTYVHGRYGLAAAERLHGFPSVRSNIDLEAGVDAAERLTLRGVAAWQIRHKGPTIPSLNAFDWLAHDRFIVSSYFNVGGGLTISMTENTELHALWISTVSGNNGAHRARMLAIGTSWSFGSGWGGFGGEVKSSRSR